MQRKAKRLATIILAGGSSSRLGTPKQLVLFNGETLLAKIVNEVRKTNYLPLVVVLGNEPQKYENILKDKNLKIVENSEWQKGMGSSLSCGVKYLTEIEKNLDGLIVCVCDQPFVTGDIIENLARVYAEKDCRIAASAYDETIGVPAVFEKSLFSELVALDGNIGARKIIEKYRKETALVNFPKGGIDIDTPGDIKRLGEFE